MDNQCDITKTAEKIYIHRNTVKYRINKCSNLIGTNIEDPSQSLNIRIALYVSEMITFDYEKAVVAVTTTAFCRLLRMGLIKYTGVFILFGLS